MSGSITAHVSVLVRELRTSFNPFTQFLFFLRNPKLKNFKEVVGIFEHITATKYLKRLSQSQCCFDQLKQVKGKSKIHNCDFLIIVLVNTRCT